MTSTVRQLFPRPDGPAEVEPDAVLRAVDQVTLDVGDERIVGFLTGFARKLLTPALARRHPELASLGFFLRKAELAKALSTLDAQDPAVLRFPRGLVFHLPPANVDTVFVYSWALSALAGNHNVVRVSGRAAGAADAVLTALHDTLADADPEVARAITGSQRMITYGHDDAVGSALSAACDLRVIWGGDAAVHAIRRYPLSPAARDLTFPDRNSYAAISVPAWTAADTAARHTAALGFFHDAYWFDQAACSSPRTVFWIGDPEPAAAAKADFAAHLRAVLDEQGHHTDAAMAVQKHVAGYGLAADGQATAIRFHGNALATLDLAADAEPPRHWLGAGTFAHRTLPRLDDLADVVRRADQTLSVYGFTQDELLGLARTLRGRGIDRIVPFGSALAFSAVWDGYDLLREFTRLTTVRG